MNAFYIVSVIAAGLAFLGGCAYAVIPFAKKDILFRNMTYRLVFFVFLAAFCLFLPLFWGEHIALDGYSFYAVMRTVLLSMQSALKLFFGDFHYHEFFARLHELEVPVTQNGQELHIPLLSDRTILWAGSMMATLSAVAPVLSIAAVLDMVRVVFVHLAAERSAQKRDIFLFSELNHSSITLARSIRDDYSGKSAADDKDSKKQMPLLIFCDVFTEENEKCFNLANDLREIGGVSYKEDLLTVDQKLRRRYRRAHGAKVNYFLLGEDETENVYQACRLAENYSSTSSKRDLTVQRPLAVYVMAVKESNIALLDSLTRLDATELMTQKDFISFVKDMNLDALSRSTPASFDRLRTDFIENKKTEKLYRCAEQMMPMIIKRIDPYKRLAWKTIINDENFLYQQGKPTISVLIAGVSNFGREFLKALCWFYQLPVKDSLVDIHVVDLRDDLEDYLMGVCPELLFFGTRDGSEDDLIREKDDAHYRITLHSGVDVFSGAFEKILRDTPSLRTPSAAFVCLGGDSLNTEGAMRVRSLFSRYAPGNQAKVFAVVYDNVLYENLQFSQDDTANDRLCAPVLDKKSNDKQASYNITFIGALKDLYNYNELQGYSCIWRTEDDSVDEETAFFHHFAWAFYDTYKEVVKKYKPSAASADGDNAVENGDNAVENAPQSGENAPQNVENDGKNVENSPANVENHTPEATENTDDKDKQEMEKLLAEHFAEYVNFEYYQQSSLATRMHRYMLEKSFHMATTFEAAVPGIGETFYHFSAEEYEESRVLEHARWCCYMRGEGYVYDGRKDAVGKVHKLLTPYENIDIWDRQKN